MWAVLPSQHQARREAAAQWQSQIPLLQGLVAYWRLNEVSGTRADAHSTNHLTDNNSVGSELGKQGNAALFDGTNWLSIADNAALSIGPAQSFTVALWFYPTGSLTQRTLIAKGNGNVSNGSEFALYLTVGSLQFDVMNGTSTGSKATAALSLNTWYHAVAWYDDAVHTVNIRLNGGSVLSASYSGGSQDTSNPLEIGRWPVFNAWKASGDIDEVSLHKRVLTLAEMDQLYNSGNGISYPFV